MAVALELARLSMTEGNVWLVMHYAIQHVNQVEAPTGQPGTPTGSRLTQKTLPKSLRYLLFLAKSLPSLSIHF